MAGNGKPKVAFFDFASCEGCQLTVVDALQTHLELVEAVEIVQFREAMTEKKPEGDRQDLRKKVLDVIGSAKDGIEYGKLIEASEATEAEVEKVINDLLAEGICYEPTPGKIRKI